MLEKNHILIVCASIAAAVLILMIGTAIRDSIESKESKQLKPHAKKQLATVSSFFPSFIEIGSFGKKILKFTLI